MLPALQSNDISARRLLRIHLAAIGIVVLIFATLILAHRIIVNRVNVTKWEMANFLGGFFETGDLIWLFAAHLGLWEGLISTNAGLVDKWKYRHLWMFLAGVILASSIMSVSMSYWLATFSEDRALHIAAVLEWRGSPVGYYFNTLDVSAVSILLIVFACPIAALAERKQTYTETRAKIIYAVTFFGAASVWMWLCSDLMLGLIRVPERVWRWA